MTERPASADVNVRTKRGIDLSIGPLRPTEVESLYRMFAEVVVSGDGFPQAAPLSREEFDEIWRPGRERCISIVARAGSTGSGAGSGGSSSGGGSGGGGAAAGGDGGGGGAEGGAIYGAYYLKPNFAARAAHIANAGYVVAAGQRRAGVGRALVIDSIWRAPVLGYDAVQFNLVFESNPARRLYESLGWREIGRIPEAVDGGDAIIYWRKVP